MRLVPLAALGPLGPLVELSAVRLGLDGGAVVIRYTQTHPCPICGGWERQPRHRGGRCVGFLSDDGSWARCTREEAAGGLPLDERTSPATYRHRIGGPCDCGKEHAPARPAPNGHGREHRWVIRDAAGRPVAVHVRLDRPGQDKRLWWELPDGRKGLGGLHPRDLLYGLESLSTALGLPVLLVEGEKAADAAQAALGGRWVVVGTVCGAPKVPSREALAHLRAADLVVVWPDHDDPGCAQMEAAGATLEELGCEVRWVRAPDAAPSGWDAADADPDQVRELVEGATPRPQDGQLPAPRRLNVISLADVEAEPVPWLWRGWIARGALTVVTGHPDMGKSWFTYAVAAAISQGWPLPGDPTTRPALRVLSLGSEDPLKYVVRPRLDSLGADPRMVDAVQGTVVEGMPGHFSLSADLDLLDQRLTEVPYCLVVISPLNAYMGNTDTHREADVRRVLNPLAELAERHDVAVIAIIHPTKAGQGLLPLYRIQGSVANSAACRTAIVVGKDEAADGERSPRRHLVLLKNNLMPDEDKPAPLCFELTRERGFQWAGNSSATQAVLLGGGGPDDERDDRSEAEEFLSHALAESASKEVDSRAALTAWKAEGKSERTLQWTKKKLGWTTRREGFGPGSRVFWIPPAGKADPHRRNENPIGANKICVAPIAPMAAPIAPMGGGEAGHKRCPLGHICSRSEPTGSLHCCGEPMGSTDDAARHESGREGGEI